MQTQNSITFEHNKPFRLENGGVLDNLRIAYSTFGELNAEKNNVVWVFHALTANSDPTEWWPGLVGDGHLINPEKYFIVCANIIGSCYGSTGPEDEELIGQGRFGLDFPLITIRDMVRAHQLLQQYLNIDRIHLGVGGSMGGQQVLEWAITDAHLFENICIVASNAVHSSWGKAFNTAQRMALEADNTFANNLPGGGKLGIQAARATGMLSYRHYETFAETQHDPVDHLSNARADSYQRYQGKKLSQRFGAYSYNTLSLAMDSHNVGRGYLSVSEALSKIAANTLVLGIDTDILFPLAEQEFIANNIRSAHFEKIHSKFGHDGFLIETAQITEHLEHFLKEEPVWQK